MAARLHDLTPDPYLSDTRKPCIVATRFTYQFEEALLDQLEEEVSMQVEREAYCSFVEDYSVKLPGKKSYCDREYLNISVQTKELAIRQRYLGNS